MEAEFIFRLTFLALRILLMSYTDEYDIKDPYVFFHEGERIVLTGEFKGMKKLVLCDNEQYDKCSFQNEQLIILKGQTQLLIQISIYPWYYGDQVWYHPVPSTRNKGYRFMIGQLYDRVLPIEKGGY